MELACRLIVIIFGIWLICVSLLMVVRPKIALAALRRFGSTNLINYTELGLRLIVGIAFIGLAPHSDHEQTFKLMGGFLALTAIVLICVPRRWHHNYAVWWAGKLKPFQIQLCAPLSFLAGTIFIGLAA